MNRFFKSAIAAVLVLGSPLVCAFKVDTHIWIGQQVLNDVQDGQLDFYLGNKKIQLPIDSSLRDAIVANPSEFLMGNIGPDAVPDVVAGQMVVHPGIEDGWKTNDWMQHALNSLEYDPKGQAFSYGYLGHAAADVFAHTYVNQYAGDEFALFREDGTTLDETLVEQRHMVLEGYISEFLPPLKDHRGTSLGEPWQQITLNDEYAQLMRDAFVYNDEAHLQYQNSKGGLHLAAYYSFRQSLQNLSEQGIWREIDAFVLMIVAAANGVDLSKDEADLIIKEVQPLLEALNGDVVDEIQRIDDDVFDFFHKYEVMKSEGLQSAYDKFVAEEGRLIAKLNDLKRTTANLDNDLRNKSCEILKDIAHAPIGVHTKLVESLGLGSDLEELLIKSADPLGLNDPISDALFGSDDPEPPKVMTITYDANGYIAEAQKLEDQALSMENTIEQKGGLDYIIQQHRIGGMALQHLQWQQSTIKNNRSEAKLYREIAKDLLPGEKATIIRPESGSAPIGYVGASGKTGLCQTANTFISSANMQAINLSNKLEREIIDHKNQSKQDLIDLQNELIKTAQAIHDIKNAYIDLAQVMSVDSSPIKGYLEGWVLDLDNAMTAYIKAASQMMINSVNKSASTMEPMEAWFKCHHAAIIGISSAISGCGPKQSMEDLKTGLNSIMDIMNAAPLPPGLRDAHTRIIELRDDLIVQARQELKDATYEYITDMIPEHLMELIELSQAKHITESLLNSTFSKPENVYPLKNLVMIPDMSQRVHAEMHVVNGAFDPDKFTVIRNAIVLAKMALLDAQGLVALEAQADLPYGTLSLSGNIVAGAFANIDGNHQWMEISPSRPDSVGLPYRAGVKYSSEMGFLPWQGQSRDKVFRQLFVDVLSPGIDYPAELGLSEVVPSSYPYKPCTAHPYPDNEQDKTCDVIYLIPILHLLMN